MKVICPQCNIPMELSDVVSGTNIKCATCRNVFLAGGSQPSPTPPPPVPENIERTPCPFCQHMVVKDALKCPNCKGTIGAITCPSCKESIPANTITCPHCQTRTGKPAGQPAPQPKRMCPACDNLFPSHNSTCQTCRVPLGPVPQSKLLLIFIAFLVPVGIHRFLMGYTSIGIAQVILTAFCGIGFIWSWIDGFLILTSNLKMADGQDLLDNDRL